MHQSLQTLLLVCWNLADVLQTEIQGKVWTGGETEECFYRVTVRAVKLKSHEMGVLVSRLYPCFWFTL